MQATIKRQRNKIQQYVRITWKKIKQLPDQILVIIFIVMLGFAGWYEYNGGQEVFNALPLPAILQRADKQKNYDTIALRNIAYITESEILYQHDYEGDAVNEVAFDRHFKTLASSDSQGEIKIWDVEEDLGNVEKVKNEEKKISKQTLKSQDKTNGYYSVAFSPDGKTLTAISLEGTIQLWKASKSNNKSKSKSSENSLTRSRFLPAGSIPIKPGSEIELDGVAFNPKPKNDDTSEFAIAYKVGKNKKDDNKFTEFISLWRNKKETLHQVISGQKSDYSVDCVGFSSDGKILASGNSDGTITLWDVAVKDKPSTSLSTLEDRMNDGFTNIAFYTTSRNFLPFKKNRLVSVSGDGTIKLWDIDDNIRSPKKKKVTQPIKTLDGSEGIISIAVDPRGKILATGSTDGSIQLWDLSNGKLIRTLKSHPSAVYSLAFSPNGRFLASGSMDETIKIWKVDSRLYMGWDWEQSPVRSLIF
jgi:WD40 repeat protein